jgi:hypothetical protein
MMDEPTPVWLIILGIVFVGLMAAWLFTRGEHRKKVNEMTEKAVGHTLSGAVVLGILLLVIGLCVWGYNHLITLPAIAEQYCEQEYQYVPAEDGVGAYHLASGIAAPLTKYETREAAMEACIKYHKKYFSTDLGFYKKWVNGEFD